MISICMIVKNSENTLEQCLEPLTVLGYEIIVVDTGSIDNTKQIAMKYTDKVYDYVWQQDFLKPEIIVLVKLLMNMYLYRQR